MRLYRLLILLVSPVIAARLLLGLFNRRETRDGLAQRMGFGTVPDDARHTVWLHGASMGELTSARQFVQHLLAQNTSLHVVVTCNTASARDMVTAWNNSRLHARFAPLDSPAILRRFLRNWRPRLAFTLENELWPNRIMVCAGSGLPFIVLGGRISRRSHAVWRKFPALARQVMGAITALAPLDAENGGRFQELGLPVANISDPVNLKSGVRLAPPDPVELARLARFFARNSTLLAASSHAGEEETILAAFSAARANNPTLRLILAPRHRERGDSVARLIASYGFSCDRRSAGTDIDMKNQVYLADTVGEMPLWYTLSALTILGGSFISIGGHTPVEPVQFGSAVIHGPDISNHSDAYASLHKHNAAFCAADAASLGVLICDLLQNQDTDAIAGRATAALGGLLADNPDPQTLLRQLDEVSGGQLAAALLNRPKYGIIGNDRAD